MGVQYDLQTQKRGDILPLFCVCSLLFRYLKLIGYTAEDIPWHLRIYGGPTFEISLIGQVIPLYSKVKMLVTV